MASNCSSTLNFCKKEHEKSVNAEQSPILCLAKNSTSSTISEVVASAKAGTTHEIVCSTTWKENSSSCLIVCAPIKVNIGITECNISSGEIAASAATTRILSKDFITFVMQEASVSSEYKIGSFPSVPKVSKSSRISKSNFNNSNEPLKFSLLSFSKTSSIIVTFFKWVEAMKETSCSFIACRVDADDLLLRLGILDCCSDELLRDESFKICTNNAFGKVSDSNFKTFSKIWDGGNAPFVALAASVTSLMRWSFGAGNMMMFACEAKNAKMIGPVFFSPTKDTNSLPNWSTAVLRSAAFSTIFLTSKWQTLGDTIEISLVESPYNVVSKMDSFPADLKLACLKISNAL
ncbi:hypothetical protein OGATHE_002750 [Ogataea polymorpha]|uniref:Uncharacterized protein n=1 Tax=Ogataea polymorpha TaxID=460523 RepID=A0A9P8PCW4_9ASCO|nr:hypothetical protein OGATHE_002750 [Ogataea polymorpha]